MPRIDTPYPGVCLINGEVAGRPLQLPLLIGSERALLIDSGSAADPERLILPALEALQVPLEQFGLLVTTHCDFDHQGGNAALKGMIPDLRLYCGEGDRAAIESPEVIVAQRYDAYRPHHGHHYSEETLAWIRTQLGDPQPVDAIAREGDRFRLGPDWEVEILHLPGHSWGHLGVLDLKHQVLFGGDAVQGSCYRDLADQPILCPTYLHVRPYLETIDRLATLELEGYQGCHWPLAHGAEAIREFLHASKAFVERAERVVLLLVGEAGSRGITLSELCAAAGPSLGEWPASANFDLCYPLAGHLADLVDRGLVREHAGDPPYRYTATP